MTTNTNARVAGITFVLYIAVGLTSVYVSSVMTGDAEQAGAKLAAIFQSKLLAQINIILTLIAAACAVVLAITPHAACSIHREISKILLSTRWTPARERGVPVPYEGQLDGRIRVTRTTQERYKCRWRPMH
jgi:hypothetical protein